MPGHRHGQHPRNSRRWTSDGDHFYLANHALWDDWFLSGIAPQTVDTFSKPRTQGTGALEFFHGTPKLPRVAYLANLRGQDGPKLTPSLISGSIPNARATLNFASYITVDGMFNANSTSVEAWKALLGGRKGRPVVIRGANGNESVQTGDANMERPRYLNQLL